MTVSIPVPSVMLSAPVPPVILWIRSPSANAVSPVSLTERSLTLILPSPSTSIDKVSVPSINTKSPLTPPKKPGASAVLAESPLSVSVYVIPPAGSVKLI